MQAYVGELRRIGELLAVQSPDKALAEAQEAVRSMAAQVGQVMAPVLDGLPQLRVPAFDPSIFAPIGRLTAQVQRQLAPLPESLAESFRNLPPRTRQALLLLGEHGWYLDLDMSLPSLWRLEQALEDGDVGLVERSLSRHFTKRLKEIEKALCSRFPHRSRIITLAFKAHRRREYELSIPVLLAQTDGICKEAAGGYYFVRKDRRPETSIYVEQIASDSLLSALLSPLAQTLPVGASRRNQPNASEGLNRHTILHGDSVDYGTRVNSLKTVSLINYVAQVLGRSLDRRQQDNGTPG